jgi:hypothetical protein
MGILLTAIPPCLLAHAPEWLIVALGASLVLVFLTSLFAYVYFMLKAPDALRSESFNLSKLAMDKGLIGDDVSGFRRAEVVQEERARLGGPTGPIQGEDP